MKIDELSFEEALSKLEEAVRDLEKEASRKIDVELLDKYVEGKKIYMSMSFPVI